MAEINPASGFVQSWANDCDDSSLANEITNVESFISELGAKIIKPIADELARINPVVEYCKDCITTDFANRIDKVESYIYGLERKIQDDIISIQAPLFVAVNEIISQVMPLGYQPIGPLALQPKPANVIIAPTYIVDDNDNLVEIERPIESGKILTPTLAPDAPAANTTTMLDQTSRLVSSLSESVRAALLNGNRSETTPIDVNNPLWVIVPNGISELDKSTIVASNRFPASSGASVIGPFFSLGSIELLAKNFINFTNDNRSNVFSSGSDTANSCPVIVTINCPAANVLADGDSQDDTISAPSDDTDTASAVCEAIAEQPTELLEWLETEDGQQAVDNAYESIGIGANDWSSLVPHINDHSFISNFNELGPQEGN